MDRAGRAERRILARGSARPRAVPNAQNSQLWSPGGLPPAGIHVHFAGVQQSVWNCQELAQSSIGALDRGWHLACRCPHLRRRSSSIDVPDNVPESQSAARPFPGPRQAVTFGGKWQGTFDTIWQGRLVRDSAAWRRRQLSTSHDPDDERFACRLDDLPGDHRKVG